MLDFSSLSRGSWLGGVLRKLANLVPRDAVMPILQGPNRGFRWVVGNGTNGFWLGSFESRIQKFLRRHLNKRQVFWDVGAHAGFYTLLGSRYAKEVVAIEPMTANVSSFYKTIALNRVTNARLIEVAVSDVDGEVLIKPGDDSFTHKVSSDGTVRVKCATIDALVRRGFPPPDCIKMDVEGHEEAALRGAHETLRTYHPVLQVETSNPRARVLEYLESLGYDVRAELGQVFCTYTPRRTDDRLVGAPPRQSRAERDC